MIRNITSHSVIISEVYYAIHRCPLFTVFYIYFFFFYSVQGKGFYTFGDNNGFCFALPTELYFTRAVKIQYNLLFYYVRVLLHCDVNFYLYDEPRTTAV